MISMRPIGRLRTDFPERFGIPRQAGLASEAIARLELDPAVLGPESLRGIEEFTHLWVVFWCHGIAGASQRDTVRPPRLGGNQRVGTLASRSPYRPNPIGLSLVRLLGVEGMTLELAGGDFLDDTPVLDLKPYLAWADSDPRADSSWANSPPEALPVEFADGANATLAEHDGGERLKRLAIQCLRYDPRPAYDADRERSHAMRVGDLEFHFVASPESIRVEAVREVPR
jgi:tRNA-Thr(GGU) m(6)t(6)A37 methyltransferase TsaA